MKKIVLKRFYHRGAEQIGIVFDYDTEVKNYIKSFEGVKWSQTHKMFYVLKSVEHRRKLFTFLTEEGFYVDYSALTTKTITPEKRISKPSKVLLYKALPA